MSGYEGIMEQYVGEPLADKVEVGDYIKYGEKLTAKTYTTNTNETGWTETQTFETDTDMLWRVMNKKANGEVEILAVSNILENELTEEGTGEGSGLLSPMSLLTIEAEPMLLAAQIENVKTGGLYLKGEKGFVNAETVLKNLCDKLYTSSYGEARSINVDDINALTGYKPEATTSYTYTSGKFWDKASNTFKTATTADPVTVENSDYYYYKGGETTMFFWLGSRSADAHGNHAFFEVRAVYSGAVRGLALVDANTDGIFDEREYAYGVRSVVTLKSNIQVEETTATGGVTTWAIK